MAVEGSTTKEVFEAYLEQVLLPELEEGQVLIMDKLAAHKPNRVRELIEGRGLSFCTCPATPGLQPHRDLPTTMHLQTQTILSLASKGCSGSWRW